MIARKAADAIEAGCTLVVKPAAETPLSALALAQTAEEAGLPKGVFNVIPADHSRIGGISKFLCESHDVSCISFTGSTGVGRVNSFTSHNVVASNAFFSFCYLNLRPQLNEFDSNLEEMRRLSFLKAPTWMSLFRVPLPPNFGARVRRACLRIAFTFIQRFTMSSFKNCRTQCPSLFAGMDSMTRPLKAP